MKLTKEALAQIRERYEKASSEPWTYIPNENLVVKYESRLCRERIAEMVSESNGPFLAGSSTDIPNLLTHIEELERENKPHGRMATSFPICWTWCSDPMILSNGHIDLSVFGDKK